MSTRIKTHQRGASLIEILISILILSFGLLGMAQMMAASVQLPKLAALRSTASALAAAHIDRIRVNPAGFAAGNYDVNLSYDATFNTIDRIDCSYPSCTSASLATMDTAYTNNALRTALPAGGMRVERDNTSGTPSTTEGNLWVVWQEPASASAFASMHSSDNCPAAVTGTFTNPAPRCLYIRFRL